MVRLSFLLLYKHFKLYSPLHINPSSWTLQPKVFPRNHNFLSLKKDHSYSFFWIYRKKKIEGNIYIPSFLVTKNMIRGMVPNSISNVDTIYGTDLFYPSQPPSEWLKMIFLRWLKFNFRNGFGCWNLIHHLIRQSRSFFKQKMGCRSLKWVRTARPNLGVFSKFSKYTFFIALFLSL